MHESLGNWLASDGCNGDGRRRRIPTRYDDEESYCSEDQSSVSVGSYSYDTSYLSSTDGSFDTTSYLSSVYSEDYSVRTVRSAWFSTSRSDKLKKVILCMVAFRLCILMKTVDIVSDSNRMIINTFDPSVRETMLNEKKDGPMEGRRDHPALYAMDRTGMQQRQAPPPPLDRRRPVQQRQQHADEALKQQPRQDMARHGYVQTLPAVTIGVASSGGAHVSNAKISQQPHQYSSDLVEGRRPIYSQSTFDFRQQQMTTQTHEGLQVAGQQQLTSAVDAPQLNIYQDIKSTDNSNTQVEQPPPVAAAAGSPPNVQHAEDFIASSPETASLAESKDRKDVVVAAQGAGPELIGLAGQVYKFQGEDKGVFWYNVLSSPKFQWNMAIYGWDSCPPGEKMFVGDTGFTIHEPDANDPTRVKSKHLQFRMERRDVRECLFNSSQSCLAGGNLLMKLGKTAKETFHPGDHSLKGDAGATRIVAYNAAMACRRKWHDSTESGGRTDDGLGDVAGARRALERTPIDYLRGTVSSTIDPERCEAWVKERESGDDLFSFNSDTANVHVDTPWMQITIQIQQNKVGTKKSCAYASMNVWITNISPELLEDEFGGVLGGAQLAKIEAEVGPVTKGQALSFMEGSMLKVDGPFGT